MQYTPTHEWIRVDEHDEMTMGISDHAQALLGDIVFIELPNVGDIIHSGDSIGVIESVKAASDLYAPISGTVTATNPIIHDQIAVINHDPEHTGWLIKIKPNHPKELDALLSADDYRQMIAEE